MTKDNSTKRTSARGSSPPDQGTAKLRREILAKVAGTSDKPQHAIMRLVDAVLDAPDRDAAAEAMMKLLLAFNKKTAGELNTMILFATPIAMLHHSDWIGFYRGMRIGLERLPSFKGPKMATSGRGTKKGSRR